MKSKCYFSVQDKLHLESWWIISFFMD